MSSNISAQIEADKRLIHFSCYEDYLNSFLTVVDHCYLQSQVVSNRIAELGYRASGETLTRQQFERRLAAVRAYLYPKFKPYVLASEGVKSGERLFVELALRETSNRLGILSTIIYLRQMTKSGFEISGYIDYHERLTSEDWKPFFKGVKRLWPRSTDLGFYKWRTNKSTCNDSQNFKFLIDPNKGLLFQNRYDRKIICVDPTKLPGPGTVRTRVRSDLYENVVLFDHLVMQRI